MVERADATGVPFFFAEILSEVESHQKALGGLKHFKGSPFIDHKVTRKELAESHTDYEYIYLTILGLAKLHLQCEEIVRKNNGQSFNRNPGVQLLERVTGLTMHAERDGSNHLLRTSPASLIEAFQLSKADPGGPLMFFKTAFDRTADPCLEGRMGRVMEYIESRRRAADPAASCAPPWEDVTLRVLPEGSPVREVIGEHLRVFVAECTWRWAVQQGLKYDDAKEVRFGEKKEEFSQLFNAATFEAAMLARGVASDSHLRQWQSATKSGEWMPYDPDVSLQIEKAHEKGLSLISIRLGPKAWTYQIDFENMVQRNPKTGQERPLRVVEASASDGRGPLTREALVEAIRFFVVDLETLPPAPSESPTSTLAGTTIPDSADAGDSPTLASEVTPLESPEGAPLGEPCLDKPSSF